MAIDQWQRLKLIGCGLIQCDVGWSVLKKVCVPKFNHSVSKCCLLLHIIIIMLVCKVNFSILAISNLAISNYYFQSYYFQSCYFALHGKVGNGKIGNSYIACCLCRGVSNI